VRADGAAADAARIPGTPDRVDRRRPDVLIGDPAQAGLGWAAKNRQSVAVASNADDGGSSPRARSATVRGGAPGHWCPAPAIVISSTARPSGQPATEVVTGSSTRLTAGAQPSARRH